MELTSLSNRVIADFIFGKLSNKEEREIVDFLMEHEDYGESLDGLIDFCLETNCSHIEFIQYIENIYTPQPNRYKNAFDTGSNKKLRMLRTKYRHGIFWKAATIILLVGLNFLIVILTIKVKQVNSLKYSMQKPNLEEDLFKMKSDSIIKVNHDAINEYKPKLKHNETLAVKSEKGSLFSLNKDLEQRKKMLLAERSYKIKILAPSANEIFKTTDTLVFKWELLSNDVFVRFKFLNSNGKSLIDEEGLKNTFRITTKVLPGIYYWQLETAEEILYIGNIVVVNS